MMRVLLDTHALIWWLADDPALPESARWVIADPDVEVLVSAASAMEATTKHRIGKLPQASELVQNFASFVENEGFRSWPISVRHAALAGSLQIAHKDPFDRILIAQSLLEAIALVSNERMFDDFGVTRVW